MIKMLLLLIVGKELVLKYIHANKTSQSKKENADKLKAVASGLDTSINSFEEI